MSGLMYGRLSCGPLGRMAYNDPSSAVGQFILAECSQEFLNRGPQIAGLASPCAAATTSEGKVSAAAVICFPATSSHQRELAIVSKHQARLKAKYLNFLRRLNATSS